MRTRRSRPLLFAVAACLMAGPASAFQVQKVNGPLREESGVVVGDVYDYAWSPDGRRILYTADEGAPGGQHLYSVVRAPGLPRVVLSVSENDLIRSIRFTPDGQVVLYRDQDYLAPGDFGPSPSSLYSVPIDGSVAAVPLGDPSVLPSDQFVAGFPSNETVLFRDWEEQLVDVANLHLSPVDASAPPIQLAPNAGAGLQLTRSGDLAVYYPHFLWSVPTDGSAPPSVLHNDPDTRSSYGRIHPDDRQVLFVRGRRLNRSEIYRIPLDGSAPATRVSQWMPSNGLQVEGPFEISPDGDYVVYRADADTDDVIELYSAEIETGTVAKLSGAMVAGGDVPFDYYPNFGISPDSRYVVYRADQDVDEVFELFAAPIDGSAPPVKMHPAVTAGPSVEKGFFFVRDRVVFGLDLTGTGTVHLYAAALDGSAPAVQLTPPMVPGGSVATTTIGILNTVAIEPLEGRVTYRADQETDGTTELFTVGLDGAGAAVKRNAPLVAGGDVYSFAVGPGPGLLLYLADQEIDGVDELWLVEPGPRPGPRSDRRSSPVDAGRRVVD